jgi:hypothetical protein
MKSDTLVAPGDKSRFFLTCVFYALQGVTLVSSLFGAYIVRYHEKAPEATFVSNLLDLFDNGDILNRNSKWSPLLGFWVAGKKILTKK